jgi:predicted transcriptional regulator
MTRKERSQSEILQDILIVILEEREASKTRIMHRANLNQKTFQKYFSSLLSNGFIVLHNDYGETYRKYRITRRGRETLDHLRAVNTILPGEIAESSLA